MRRALLVFAALLGLVTTACVPPPGPAPVVPAGIGVQFVRDTGGTIDPEGHYLPAYDRYVVTAGVASGPTPIGSNADVRSPWGGTAWYHLLPDGTSRYPENGFAGEGIVGTDDHGLLTMTFPGGTCRISLFDDDDFVAVPSPDGSKVAVSVRNIDASSSRIQIVSLVDAATCPSVVTDGYVEPSGYGDFVSAHIVWAPDSSAVVYPIVNTDDVATHRLVRLDAAPGAEPELVIPADTVQILAPLGWSVAGRLLVETSSGSRLLLATLPATGGTLRVLSTLDLASYSAPLPQSIFLYLGYFVPGTTTVVYTDPDDVTNSTGESFPWFRIRRIADQAGASSLPLVTPKATLTWHDEVTDVFVGPPFPTVQVPNSEALERFVR